MSTITITTEDLGKLWNIAEILETNAYLAVELSARNNDNHPEAEHARGYYEGISATLEALIGKVNLDEWLHGASGQQQHLLDKVNNTGTV